MANRKHLINVHTSTGTEAPTGASLYLGEIAVQHTPNEPAIWIKMGSAETSTEYEKFIGETEINQLISSGGPFVSGEGENSAQQKGTGAEAMSEASVAIGKNTFVGQKGYKYTNTGSVTNQLTLTSVDGLAVGDTVSIVNDSKYPNCSTITGINGTTVTFDSLPFDSIVPDLTGFDDYIVYVSAKPNVGDVELAIAAHAEGDGTKAQNYTAHAEGRDTKALGEYSHAEGRDTIAQYAAHAEGKETKAEGEESHSEGIRTSASGKHSHAEGDITEATNYNAHAEGYLAKATGNSSHAEGGKWVKGATGAARINGGTANGDGSHAEGGKTVSEGNFSHAEGYLTIANENNSHAEGQNSRTGGETRPSLGGTNDAQNSHAEGSGTWAIGLGAHSEGGHTVASGNYSHAEGYETQAGGLTKLGPNSHTEGFKTATGDETLFNSTKANTNSTPGAHAHAEGNVTVAIGRGSHSEGEKTKASGAASHAEGSETIASGVSSHAEGYNTTASGQSSHAEGWGTTASGQRSHAEGESTTANGISSHAEGCQTEAYGTYSHAEGYNTTASGTDSHAEGWSTTASGQRCHAEGESTTANGYCSHAEGYRTTASGGNSHAEGGNTAAYGNYSHAEGYFTAASGRYSHAEGSYITARNQSEHAEGQYNVSNSATTQYGSSGNTQHSVGIGTSSEKKNAFEIMQNGDAYLYGVGGYSGTSIGNGILTLQEVLNSIPDNTLGSGYTYSGLSYIDSSTTIADAFSALTNELIKDEKVTAAALNELNVKTNEINSIKRIISEDEEVVAGAINDLNERVATVETHMSGEYIQITGYQLASGSTEEELALTEEDTVDEAFGKLQKQMLDNEEAIAAGFNDLNNKVDDLEEQVKQNSGAVRTLSAATTAGFDYLTEEINSISAKTAGVLTLNLNGVEQGQYCPSASTTINLEAIQEVTGADVLLTGYELATGSTEQELVVLATDTVNEAFGKLQKQNYDNEAVVAGALNDLDERVAALEEGESIEELSAATVNIENNLDVLSGVVIDNELVTASALINLDNKISGVSVDVNTVSGVIMDTSYVVGIALNDLNDKINELSGNTGISELSAATISIEDGLETLSGVTEDVASLWERGTGEYSVQQKGSNGTAFGNNSVVEGASVTNAIERGITSASTDDEIIAEWSGSTPDTDKFSLAKGEASHAEGNNGLALGNHSHVEGNGCIASNNSAHAEGTGAQATNKYAHAEGLETLASGKQSHSEGSKTIASASSSHSEGESTTANQAAAHAEGINTVAGTGSQPTAYKDETDGRFAHAEGNGTWAKGSASHAEGRHTVAGGESSHAEGRENTASGNRSHAEGMGTQAKGNQSHSEGNDTVTNAWASHTEGYNTETGGDYSSNTKTPDTDDKNGDTAHAEGNATIAKGAASHSEGIITFASGKASHAEGYNTTASGNYSHAEGRSTTASGNYSHAEGYYTTASGNYSHTEGSGTAASGEFSHAEGESTTTNGISSHAEGCQTEAYGTYSHAEGYNTTASGQSSHAEGYYTTTVNRSEHAEGQYNVSHSATTEYGNSGNTQHSVGIGSNSSSRKNAFEIMQNGDAYLFGVGGYDGTNATAGTSSTLQQVLSNIGCLTEITWSELKTLRDGSGLTPGMQYRITDYNTTTSQEDTQSAGHQFDIIVVADSVNKLNENARAVLHSGDTYFSTAGAKLEAWELKYDLDNDTAKYSWADSGATGRGVIYWMKDEWNNECPYDFKNIQFKRKLTDGEYNPKGGTDTWVYTFTWVNEDNVVEDLSIVGNSLQNDEGHYTGIYDNVIKSISAYVKIYPDSPTEFGIALNDIVFISSYLIEGGVFYGCQSNTFGNNCGFNTFGNNCNSNTFGNNCGSNTFGNNCNSNTFGNNFNSNTFGNNCDFNTFGNNCDFNTFGNNCNSNTFGNNCYFNTFGNTCGYNHFGNGCLYIKFGNASSTKSYCSYNIVENGNKYIYIDVTSTTSDNSPYRNVKIAQGVNNTTTYKTITDGNVNQTYQTVYQPANSQVINV